MTVVGDGGVVDQIWTPVRPRLSSPPEGGGTVPRIVAATGVITELVPVIDMKVPGAQELGEGDVVAIHS